MGWSGATPVGEATASLGGALLGAFTWDAAGQAFRSFNPLAPAFINTLTDLTLGDGVWINLSEATFWTQPPFAEARDVALVTGFNLVMWTGPNDIPVADAVASIAGSLEGLFIWDASAQAYRIYRPTAPTILNTADTLSFGDGVWLLMSQAATWNQPAIRTIRVGVRNDSLFGPLADFDNGTGFEFELAREVVARVFGPINVELVGTSAADRFSALQDGTIDLLIRTTSHTTSREDLASPTSNYFLDGLTLTVLAGSGITSLADFEGRTLAVGIGTSRETELQLALADAGVAVDLIELGDLGAALDLLDSGQADGLAWSYAFATAQGRDDLTTIPISLDDPWAMWTSSPDFRDEVEEALLALIDDGTWEALFSQAFGFDAPWTIEEMLAVPPIDG